MAGRLVAQRISKRFDSVMALDDVSIEFLPGEIHAVLGENGAGKSTLMQILSGFMKPQSGKVLLDGQAIPAGQPQKCRALGIEMVHQHFTLVPNFTVEENLALAKIDRLATHVDVSRVASQAIELGSKLGWNVDPKAKVGSLPVGVQQRIEILKCLVGNASILIFDEPTAVLTPDEVLDLIRVLKRLKADGKIVILIAHKLSEVMATADRVTVLRQGRVVSQALISEVDEQVLANWMVGEMPPTSSRLPNIEIVGGLEVERLEVKGDRKETAVRGVSFTVGHGEIVGIGGVDGNGQVELAEALARIRAIGSGSVSWNAKDFAKADVRVAYIPQDRQRDGLALTMSVQDNLFIGAQDLKDLRSKGILSASKVRAWARRLVERFDIRVASESQPVADLSGGNQQKIVVGRNLDRTPDMLVAVNPTRGLDVRATLFVHEQILALRKSGVAIILLSTDIDELTVLSDRILFMSRGALTDAQGASALVGGST